MCTMFLLVCKTSDASRTFSFICRFVITLSTLNFSNPDCHLSLTFYRSLVLLVHYAGDMQLPPPSVLATYPKPNYVNPESRSSKLLIANCVMMSVTLCVVGVRIYTRVYITHCFGADDLFIILAVVSCPGGTLHQSLSWEQVWAFAILVAAAITYVRIDGFRHAWDIAPASIPEMLRWLLATHILFGHAVTFVKLSLLLLIRKIMESGTKALRCIILFGIFYVIASNISFTLVLIFQCR
jgi:hypothetical protein